MLRKALIAGVAAAALSAPYVVAQDAVPQSGETQPVTNANTVDPTLPADSTAMDGQSSSTSADPNIAASQSGSMGQTSSSMQGSSMQGQSYGPGTTGYTSASGGADVAVGMGALPAVGVAGGLIVASPVAVAPKVVPTAEYVKKAAASDLFEIESSRVALERSQNGAVRRFAQMMIDHHTMTTQQLAATVRNAPAPQLEEHQRDMIADLRAAPADQFDATYVRQQLSGHMAALSLHGGYMAQGDEAALRQLAQQATPVVASHLEQAWNMSEMPRTLAMHQSENMALAEASNGGRSYRGYTVYGPGQRPEVAQTGSAATATSAAAAGGTTSETSTWSSGATGSTTSGAMSGPATGATYMSNETATPGATVAQSPAVTGSTAASVSTAVPGQTDQSAGARNLDLRTGESDAVNGGSVPNDRTGQGSAATQLGPTSPMNGTAGANTPDSDTSSGEDDPNEEPTP